MYKKILVPLDGSKLSECSLNHVKAIAIGCKVPDVVLLMVLQKPIIGIPEASGEKMARAIGKELEKAEKETHKKAEAYLAKVANNLKKSGITAQTITLWQKMAEGVAEDIINYARDKKVDLIIMTTHGRSGISRWALGSVTDKVVRHANVPVMTISPPGCRKS